MVAVAVSVVSVTRALLGLAMRVTTRSSDSSRASSSTGTLKLMLVAPVGSVTAAGSAP